MAKVLHASYSGYFPFCVPSGKITSGSFIAVSLEEAMSIFWKVKIMSFVWLSEQTATSNEGDEFKIQRSLSYDELIPIPNEQNLVCYPLPFLRYGVSTIIPDLELGLFVWGSMVQSRGTFYIPIDIYVGLGDNQPQTYTLNYPPYVEGQEESTTMNIFGHSVEARYWPTGALDPINQFNPIQITLAPLEYWPYN